jgi:hypothetical protein
VIHARLALHLLMFVNTLIVCGVLLRLFGGRFAFDAPDLQGFLMLSLPPALAAQIATALRWRHVEWWARQPAGGWQAGIAIALLTHVLFAAITTLIAAVLRSSATDLLPAAAGAFFLLLLGSLLLGGALSLPLSLLSAHWAAARRRKELGSVPAADARKGTDHAVV